MSSRSSIRTTEIYWQDFILKKTAHFIEYFIFTCLVNFSLSRTTSLSFSRRLLIAVAITLGYAGSDEWHQSFTPGREPRVRDVFIDGIGILAATVALKRLRFIWDWKK